MGDETDTAQRAADAVAGKKLARPIIAAYDFKHPARVNKDQLQALENLHEHFARLLSSTFSGAMRAVVNVDTAFVDQTSYAEYIASLSNPTMSYQFVLGPTNGQAIIDVPPSLFFAFIDRIFGGKGASQGMEPRQVTPIEIGVINRIIKRVIEDLETTWEPVLKAVVHDIELETNPEFMQVTGASEIVILLAFQVESANASGLLTLCYPFFTLESILPLLDVQAYARKGSASSRQEQQLANRLRLGEMEVEVVAEVGRIQIKLEEAQQLGAGDIVRLSARAEAPLAVYLGGSPKFLARPIVSANGELAIKIVAQVPKDYQYRYGYIEVYERHRRDDVYRFIESEG